MYNAIVVALAVWRLASMLAWEEGPFDLFPKIRYAFFVRYDQHTNMYVTHESTTAWGKLREEIGEMLICVWCNSVWLGAGATLLYYLFPALTYWLSLPLALSAAAIVVQKHVER